MKTGKTETLPRVELDLDVARAMTFSHQIPFLYGMLVSNTAATMLAHSRDAPFWLAVAWPGVIVALCLVRLTQWWRRHSLVPTPAEARGLLRRLDIFSILFSIAFLAWGMALFVASSDPLLRIQAVAYIASTGLGCSLCLMQAPRALRRVALIGTAGTGALLIATGEPVLVLVALNYALVVTAAIFIMKRHSLDFARMVASNADIVEKQLELAKLSDENLRLANIDSLTGLPNRRMFFASLDAAIARATREGASLAVGVLDLDGFRDVNDACGHGTGDRLLTAIARRLDDGATDDFEVFRLGGDEFALVARRAMTTAQLLDRGRALCRMIAEPCRLGDLAADVTATIGFTTYPDGARDAQELFDHADYALCHARRTNQRGRPILFATEHRSRIRSESIVMKALRSPELEHEIAAVFQPIVDTATREIRAFEALCRWTNPEIGQVAPDLFVPLAERIGLVHNVTAAMLPQALRELARWPEPVRLSFNLSTDDVGSPDSIATICALVRGSGVDPRRIDFEITETALVQDWEQTHDSLHMLIALGARIALDDFGTGYSSLAQIHRLPLHKIKIDRAFVTGIESNAMSRRIVQSVLKLAHEIGTISVVEGVETEAEYAAVRELGADWAQGYLFHRPMSGDAAAALVSGRPRTTAPAAPPRAAAPPPAGPATRWPEG